MNDAVPIRITGLTKTFAGEQSSAYKAIFAVSKAFAIADAVLRLQMALMQAKADPTAITPAQKFANYAAVLAAGSGVLGAIKSATFGGGRQYGGPVSADSLYRVNETGRPEMFQGSNGAQYMLPTSGGRVIPADQLLDETLKAAQTIAGFSLPVVMMVKESINRAFESGLNEGLLFERRAFQASFGLEDQREGMAAFVEKRKPSFKNR